MEIIKPERGYRDYLMRLFKHVRNSACWEYLKVSFLRAPGNELISGEERERKTGSVQLSCSLLTPPLPHRLLLISWLLEKNSEPFVCFLLQFLVGCSLAIT